MRLGVAMAVAVLASASAPAARRCDVPSPLERPLPEVPSAAQPPRTVPIGGYTLALIWTPQHCFHAVGGAESFRCGPGTTGFVLHGLWPDGEGRTWPQWCKAAAILPRRVVAAHYCATPSPQLLQHEWAKHGTCIPGATPRSYFDSSNRLFGRVRFPDMAALARATVTEGRFADMFAAANPGLASDMLRLNLDREGWLEEVWLCLDRRLRSTRCAAPASPGRVVRIRPPG